MRAAVELHVAACDSCREELRLLEEAGAAFAEFAVGEPPAQYFADYGRIVRARMAGGAAAASPKSRWRSRVSWGVTFGASALAAASLLLVLSRGLPVTEKEGLEVAEAPPALSAAQTVKRVELIPWTMPRNGPTTLRVMKGPQTEAQDVILNLAHPDSMKQLETDEGRFGYLIMGEPTLPGQKPLLGVLLKTTRDEDKDVNKDERPGLMIYSVIPGTPAYAMGLKRGDYIVTANDMKVADGSAQDAASFLSSVVTAGADAPISLQILRPMSGGHMFMVKEGVLGKYGP
jgi:hypothetical protein